MLNWVDQLISFESILLVVVLLLWGAGFPSALVKALRSVKAASVWGVEFSLTPESNEQLRDNFSRALSSLREDTNRYVEGSDPDKILISQIANAFLKDLASSSIKSVPYGRMTLHIQDPLFSKVLIQATPYYLFDKSEIGIRTTRNRRKSIRYGLIGRAWRLNASQSMKNIEHSEIELINAWGALRSEAKRYDGDRRWATALVVKDPDTANSIGILYFDDKIGNPFDDPNCQNAERDQSDAKSKLIFSHFDDAGEFLRTKKIVRKFADQVTHLNVGIDVED